MTTAPGGLRIEPLDAADRDAMTAWYDVFAAADAFDSPVVLTLKLEELRPRLLALDTGERLLAFAGHDEAGRVVCTGLVDLPLRDNLHLASVSVHTAPDRRRRSLGTRMLDHLEGVARKHDRRLLSAEVLAVYDGPPDGAGSAGTGFATARGFEFALGDVVRVLELPVDPPTLQELADGAASHHAGYTLRQWSGPVPDDVLVDFGLLLGTLMTEAPMGERELEPEVFDEARIRADEHVLADAGRTKHTTVAVAPDGTLPPTPRSRCPRTTPVAASNGARWCGASTADTGSAPR